MKQKKIVGYLSIGVVLLFCLMGVFASFDMNMPSSASAQTQEVTKGDKKEDAEIYEDKTINFDDAENNDETVEEDEIYVMPRAPWELEEKQNSGAYAQTLSVNGTQTMADDVDTYVQGKIEWLDDKEMVHPLRRVQVLIYDYESALVSQRLGSVFTDNEGNYSLGFKNKDTVIGENGGYDLYIKVSAGDSNAKVVDENGSEYAYDTKNNVRMNVLTGSTTVINMRMNMHSVKGRAFQISQALLTARDFAWNMMGRMPSDVTVRYPYDDPKDNNEIGNCYYTSSQNRITITGKPAVYIETLDLKYPESYASWDVIMHEYGHHIFYEIITTDVIGGSHYVKENMINHYIECKDENCGCVSEGGRDAKNKGIKLAWSEGWATTFGQIAQNYYIDYLTNIDYVGECAYTSYNGVDISIELAGLSDASGEGSEMAVVGALWDLFDGTEFYEESFDSIRLGYQSWWDVTTKSKAKTFSEFTQYFYTQYPKLISKFGAILEKCKMASEFQAPYTDEVEESAPHFSWVNDGGSTYFPYNKYILKFYQFDNTSDYNIISEYEIDVGNADSYTPTEEWKTIYKWECSVIHVAIIAYQTNSPVTGGYISSYKELQKPLFKTTTINGGEIKIIGTYGDITGDLTIPSHINGYPVTAIGEYAFQGRSMKNVYFEDYKMITRIGKGAFKNCPNLVLLRIPDNVTVIEDETFEGFGQENVIITYFGTGITAIGARAFKNCKPNLHKFNILESATTVGQEAFYNSAVLLEYFSSLVSIGNNAFVNNKIEYVFLSEKTTNIGNNAFSGNPDAVIYTEWKAKPSGWSVSWNSSNRPVIWGCTIDEIGRVESFEKTNSNPTNYNGIINPRYSGYTFIGWYTKSDYSGTKYDDIGSAPNGRLYAKWEIYEGSCVAEGTMITLADGTQKAVEDLTGEEMLLVWNLWTGRFEAAPILFIDSEARQAYDVIYLTFSDGTVVKVIDEHGFWDVDLNKYVYLRADAAKYIGHRFKKQATDGGNLISGEATLEAVEIKKETTTAWSPVTYGHLCYYVNGMLSMPGGITGLINIFEVDPVTMKIDEEKYAADIAAYGLYTYEEFAEKYPVPEEIFDAVQGQYLKVALGKGLLTEERVIALIDRYAKFF